MTEVVRATGLAKRYRDTAAVDGMDFRLEENTITGLLGANGAGKTTLMALLTGQRFPSEGTVEVFGERPVENDGVLSGTCFVRENQRYPNSFRVHHVLAAGQHFYPHWDAELAERLVEEFALPRKRLVRKLSRGGGLVPGSTPQGVSPGRRPRAVEVAGEVAGVRQQLARVGNNVNQLARAANQDQEVDPDALSQAVAALGRIADAAERIERGEPAQPTDSHETGGGRG